MSAELDVEGPAPIPAATVVLIMDRPDGLQTLLLHRNPNIGFGGLWVFPGGRIDPADGDTDERFRAGAVREVREETGIGLDRAQLIPHSHWLPPPSAAKRFDTMFFLAVIDGDDVVVDGAEIHDHRWGRPAELLRLHAAGCLPLVAPTWVTLHSLTGFATAADAIAGTRTDLLETFRTHVVVTPANERVAVWSGDAAYASGDLDAPGGRHRLFMPAGEWRYVRAEPPPPG